MGESESEAAAAKPGQVTVLMVDDQPAKLLTYEIMLAELGERLVKANSAAEALEQLLKQDIAVVLVDVHMPDLNGFELAAMIREHPRFQRTALIFVSAVNVAESDFLRGYEIGAVDYVSVPVVPELLRAKVRVFADLYRKTRELEALNAELEARVAERSAALERANSELERRIEDRTREREAARAQINRMQDLERLGNLTGGVAHDFNNLLTAVLANLDMLRLKLPPDAAVSRLLDNAIAGGERGVVLTGRMLAFARRQDLSPEILDLPRLIEAMADLLRRSLGPRIEIETRFDSKVAPVRLDRSQIELALLNIALNARDAMPEGGRLTLRLRGQELRHSMPGRARGAYVLLEMEDVGTGMNAEVLRRATEPFFTTKSVGQGAGLGLSTVHGFAMQSGGALEIESEPGKGTLVRLWLPVASVMLPTEERDGMQRSAELQGSRDTTAALRPVP